MTVTGIRSWVALVGCGAVCLLMPFGAAAGEETVAILGMAWTPSPGPALVLSASGPLKFTDTRPEPGVAVVDFPEAVPSEPLPPVAQPGAGLKRATLTTVEEGGRRFARLRIETEAEVRATVSSLPAGVEIRFEKAATAATRERGKDLSELLAVADESGVSVTLTASGPLQGKAFNLDHPPRVVVDLHGVVNRVTRRVQPVGAAGVQRVRVAQFATAPEPVVRVVVDLDKSLPYHLDATSNGAVLRIGGMPAQIAAAPSPAQQAPAVAATATTPPAAQTQAAPSEAAQPVKTEEVKGAPVKIVDEPVAMPVPAAATPPPAAKEGAAPAKLTAPPEPTPAATPQGAESPWTSTPTAMAEQAAPQAGTVGITKEVETQERRFTGEPISFELKDADIKDVLRTFAKITGLNIVIDPDVSGSVTVQLENVPWDQALDIILRINRLDYVVENNVLRVARLDRLTQEKAAVAAYREQEEAAKPMRTVTKVLSYAKAGDVSSILTSQGFILSKRGSVVIDPRTNQLIIRDSTDRLEGILNLIDQLDRPNPQVMIEARVVETTRTFARGLGLTWGYSAVGDAAHGTTTGRKFPYSYTGSGGVALPVPGFGPGAGGSIISFTFADILNAFNLDFALQTAETEGLAKVVSSPKVAAQDNQAAHIESGFRLPIQTVANNTVTVQYINATLTLDVTPHITAEGTVLLSIDLKKEEPAPGVNIVGATNVPLSTRNAKTILMVRDGGTTVIGGIYKFTDNDQRQGIPGLNRLPLIGALFRNRSVSSNHDELLIFITPRIIKY